MSTMKRIVVVCLLLAAPAGLAHSVEVYTKDNAPQAPKLVPGSKLRRWCQS